MNKHQVGIFGLPPSGCLGTPMRRAVVADPENPTRPAIGPLSHHLVDKTVKGRDSILGFAAAEEFGTVNVQSGQIGPRSQPFVFVLDLHGLTGLRGQRFGFSGARLNAGLFIRRDDELVGAQFTALPEALVQIQNASGLGRKLWVSRKDPAAVLPRADGILVQPSPDGGVTEGGGQTTARTWEPSSVTLQRERGTPKRLGNSQAMALTCTTSSGGENPGSAGALAVF